MRYMGNSGSLEVNLVDYYTGLDSGIQGYILDFYRIVNFPDSFKNWLKLDKSAQNGLAHPILLLLS